MNTKTAERHRRLRLLRHTAWAVATVFLLTACADEPPQPEATMQTQVVGADTFVTAAGVEVSGRYGKLPRVSVNDDFVATETSLEVLYEGSGDVVDENDTVLMDYSIFDLDTGEIIQHTYYRSPVAVELAGAKDATLMHRAVIGSKVGSRVTVLQPQGENNERNTFTVIDILPNSAQGEEVPQREDLPEVVTTDDGSVELPNVVDFTMPTSTVVQPIIRGFGSQVAEGQQVLVQLVAVSLPTGQIIDSTWRNGAVPATVDLVDSKTLEEWTQAIVGQTVGSRTLILIPMADSEDPSQAHGGIAYVVDILHAEFITEEEEAS